MHSTLHVQVLSLLEQMGLKKLQENFMTERVTGEILLECDDEVLYQELKVTNNNKSEGGWPAVLDHGYTCTVKIYY